MIRAAESASKKARQAYGPEATSVTPVPAAAVFEQASKSFLQETLHNSPEHQATIEQETMVQSDCGL